LKKILFAILCIISIEANAQQTVPDTGKKNIADTVKKDLTTAPDTVKKLHSNPLTLIPPAALITYGALSFWVHPIRHVDFYVQSEVAKSDPTFSTHAESYFLFAPIVAVYGLDLLGVQGKNTFVDRTALLALSAGFAGVSDEVLKHATWRLRPNRADHYSFPSGHTTIAFMGAEFMAQEFDAKSPWYGVFAYTVATATGVFRLYNRDHWFSDVVAGAGFGILSTKAAYLIYPYLRNWLTHTDKNGKKISFMPTYQDGAPGLAFSTQF
jgi:hypothetical protein